MRGLGAGVILNVGAVRDAWDAHMSGRHNLQDLLRGVLMFQAWKRRWMT